MGRQDTKCKEIKYKGGEKARRPGDGSVDPSTCVEYQKIFLAMDCLPASYFAERPIETAIAINKRNSSMDDHR